jgi:hypothetical protein
MSLTPERAHFCLYELHGGRCPGAPACSTADDVRDGVRCQRCRKWAETAERVLHTDPLCDEPKKGGRR